jgi:hypothetical protein
MKNLVFIIGTFWVCPIYAQEAIDEKVVPVSVRSSLQKQYPNAKNIKWLDTGNAFQADFKNNEIETWILFDKNGAALFSGTKIKIVINELPLKSRQHLKRYYNGKEILYVVKESDGRGVTNYDVKIKNALLVYDFDGSFIAEAKDSDRIGN